MEPGSTATARRRSPTTVLGTMQHLRTLAVALATSLMPTAGFTVWTRTDSCAEEGAWVWTDRHMPSRPLIHLLLGVVLALKLKLRE